MMKIYTKTGDDGTTNLFYGGRVRKDHPRPAAYGTVDEAQAAIGVARAHLTGAGELGELLLSVERDLYVLMGELATLGENRKKLTPGSTLVTAEMTRRLESLIDEHSARFDPPTEFVLPGETVAAAFLDLARTVVRRAERMSIEVAEPGSEVLRYLNRLSDLLWVLAREQEGRARLAKSLDPREQR